LRAGPKPLPRSSLDLSMLPPSGGERVVAFVEEFLRVPKGASAGERVRLRDWQRSILHGLFDDPRPRSGLVTMGRKSGKSFLAACLCLYGLVADAENGDSREVYCVSSDERTAAVTFGIARRMVELEPRLDDVLQTFQAKLGHPQDDSTFEFLPAEANRLQGRSPTLCIADELHVTKESTWLAMLLAGAARPKPLTLAISTAGEDLDGIAWKLTEHGRTGEDPDFFFREFSAPAGCDHRDESVWASANPGLYDFVAVEHLRAVARTTRESSFRRFFLNQWVKAEGAWLPLGAWAACVDATRVVPDGESIVLGFDGSYSRDSTAVVACTVAQPHHLFVLGVWERGEDPSWRVPRAEVHATVAAAFERYRVLSLVADPHGWGAEIQQWADTYGADVCLEFPTSSLPRMAPATDSFYQAVCERTLTHDGDARLNAHVSNARVRSSQWGDTVQKAYVGSPKKIDLAVAAIIAHHRAGQVKPETRRRRVVAF